MRRISLYPDEGDFRRLRRLSAIEGRRQADVIRAAITAYLAIRTPARRFALAGSWAGDGTSIGDVAEEGLLRRFGE